MKSSFLILMTLFIVTPVVAGNKTLVAHRAFYTIKMKEQNKDDQILDTNGKMIIELQHDCDGWVLKQDSVSVIDLKENPSEFMRSQYIAWESDDGKELEFLTERVYNESIKDVIRGKAQFTDSGGTIIYEDPEPTEIKMNPGTMPPITHIKKLLASAHNKEGVVSREVFDGSFYGNPVQINAFIGKPIHNFSDDRKQTNEWPMTLAVYAMPSHISTPNFEIKQNLTDDGIMHSYSINFGNYSVIGTLDSIEYLPAKICNR